MSYIIAKFTFIIICTNNSMSITGHLTCSYGHNFAKTRLDRFVRLSVQKLTTKQRIASDSRRRIDINTISFFGYFFPIFTIFYILHFTIIKRF